MTTPFLRDVENFIKQAFKRANLQINYRRMISRRSRIAIHEIVINTVIKIIRRPITKTERNFLHLTTHLIIQSEFNLHHKN